MYPSINHSDESKELRLKQEYFLCAASLSDIIRRYKTSKAAQRPSQRTDFSHFPDKAAIQLNDTHPSLIIPELMRVLVDIEKLDWDTAWNITTRTFSYTNHSVFAENLEKWPIALIEKMLPRHLEIIYEINKLHLENVEKEFPKKPDYLKSMSLVEEDYGRRLNMSYLAIVGSHAINGVSKVHSNILKTELFKQFYELTPKKFQNKTNGVTPRRWLLLCNPGLADLIYERLGDDWPVHLDKLSKLKKFADDVGFQRAVAKAKQENKMKLAEYIQIRCNVEVNPASLFDIQTKRIHEYKRQMLNCLHIITLFNRIKKNPNTTVTPRTIILAGKTTPGCKTGNLVIKLISSISNVVNNDPTIGEKLKVVFLENYRVTLAEQIIPAADLSQQISLAGTEASGTSNMKFMMNGALTIGTLDGANAEIAEEMGKENMFIFGMTAEEVKNLRKNGYDAMEFYNKLPALKQCIDQIQNGYFCPSDPNYFTDLVNILLKQDKYCILAEYQDYIRAQDEASKVYQVSHSFIYEHYLLF